MRVHLNSSNKDIDAKELERRLKVLSVASRIRIVELCKGHPMCVGSLARKVGMTQAAVSQHLRVLRDAGLVVGEKQGNFVHYAVDLNVLAQWRKDIDLFLSYDPISEG